jgi:hypothetical protein
MHAKTIDRVDFGHTCAHPQSLVTQEIPLFRGAETGELETGEQKQGRRNRGEEGSPIPAEAEAEAEEEEDSEDAEAAEEEDSEDASASASGSVFFLIPAFSAAFLASMMRAREEKSGGESGPIPSHTTVNRGPHHPPRWRRRSSSSSNNSFSNNRSTLHQDSAPLAPALDVSTTNCKLGNRRLAFPKPINCNLDSFLEATSLIVRAQHLPRVSPTFLDFLLRSSTIPGLSCSEFKRQPPFLRSPIAAFLSHRAANGNRAVRDRNGMREVRRTTICPTSSWETCGSRSTSGVHMEWEFPSH